MVIPSIVPLVVGGSSEPEAAAGLENGASRRTLSKRASPESHSNIPELSMTDNNALRPDALTPKEITEKVLNLGVTKSSMDWRTQLPLTMLAGFYIGLGGLFCTLFMSDSTLPFAVQKFMGGAVFSLGL